MDFNSLGQKEYRAQLQRQAAQLDAQILKNGILTERTRCMKCMLIGVEQGWGNSLIADAILSGREPSADMFSYSGIRTYNCK